MVKIVSDSSTLCSKEQAKENGFTCCPLSVTVDGQSYVEFEELSSKGLLDKINKGGIPSSSQPPVGDKVDVYDSFDGEDDVIDITMADGLSGTYQTAVMASQMAKNPEKVTVFNSGTLCGPHRAMVFKAVEMAREEKTKEEILNMLEKTAATDRSFLIPVDFNFLKRGGRVKGMEAGIGSLLKLVPLMEKCKDGTRLEKAAICRTMKKAIQTAADSFEQAGLTDENIIYITHAFNDDAAQKAEAYFKERFPNNRIIIYPLSPVFMTQGGPGCLAIQTIRIEE